MESKHVSTPWGKILIFLCIFVIVILYAKYNEENRKQKLADISNKFQQLESDTLFTAYLGLQEDIPVITAGISVEAERVINEFDERSIIIDPNLIRAYQKAVGSDSLVVDFFFRNDVDGVFPSTPCKTIMDLALYSSKTLQKAFYQKVKDVDDLNSALWLFRLQPDTIIKRLDGDYYTEKRIIRKRLIEYLDPSMSKLVKEKLIEWSPNEVMVNYMNNDLEEYLYKINPRRVAQIYASMSASTFANYFINEKKSTSFAFGMKSFLANNLNKVNTNDLARLVSDGVISYDQCITLLNQRPMNELLSQFDYQAFRKRGLDVVVKKAKFLKTAEEKAQFSQFMAENKQ